MSRPHYPLFQSHLDFSHQYWKGIIASSKNPCIIDATMGNGHDTLFLASLLFPSSDAKLIAMDIDTRALKNTENRLISHGYAQEIQNQQIILIERSHGDIDTLCTKESCHLIVYNLGYLPGGDSKGKTTKTDTTLESVTKASKLIGPGGVISITCYPGHDEGEKELEALSQSFTKEPYTPDSWNISQHSWVNRKKAPVLLFLQKSLPNPGV